MREVEILLDRRWVLKKSDPDTYHRLKDAYASYQELFRDKMGCRIIINPLMVKAEKLPGDVQEWMGIDAFESPMDYAFLCLVLMFLEDKLPEEQFILEQVTTYVQGGYPAEAVVDWTVFKQRKSLIRVMRFCCEEGIIIMNDGDERGFEGTGDGGVLYENTGASRYFMRHFGFDISACRSHEDFINSEWQGVDLDRGVIRRHRVHRKLLLSPVVYQNGPDDQDYLYIKNQRSAISGDLDKYLPKSSLHVHRNGAMLMLGEDSVIGDSFPGRRNISDIALQMSVTVLGYLRDLGDLGREGASVTPLPERDMQDTWTMSETKWDALLEECIHENSHGWSKGYREDMGFSKLRAELTSFMEDFGLIRLEKEEREIRVMPGMGKLSGRYPDDYLRKCRETGAEWEETDGQLED